MYAQRMFRMASVAAVLVVLGGSAPAYAQREGEILPGGAPCYALLAAAIYPPAPCGAPTGSPFGYVNAPAPVGGIQPRDLEPVYDPPCCPAGTSGSSQDDQEAVDAYLRAIDRDAMWERLSGCEAGHRWDIQGSRYGGGLQILASTWRAYGGQAWATLPGLATRAEQILVAEDILAAGGWNQWGGCSRALGLAA